MKTNKTKLRLILFWALVFSAVSVHVNAQQLPEDWTMEDLYSFSATTTAWLTVNTVIDQINAANDELHQREGARSRIEGELYDNLEDIRDGLFTAICAGALFDYGALTAAAGIVIADTMDGASLLSQFSNANSAIQEQLGIVEGIYENDYTPAYDIYILQYNALTSAAKPEIDRLTGRTTPYPKVDTPAANTYELEACASPNDTPTCYGYYRDENHHKRTCSHKHGTDGVTKEWWACFRNSCPYESEHWVECRAESCNVLFQPPTRKVLHRDPTGPSIISILEYHDHETTCERPVHSFWNPWAKCGNKYFSCEGPCGEGHLDSGSGSESQ